MVRILVSALVLVTSGCASQLAGVSITMPPDHPRVFVIGNKPIVTFDRESDVTIPIQGFNLSKATLGIQVIGTAPLVEDKAYDEKERKFVAGDFALRKASIDHDMELVIAKGYFSRAEDGDRLEVSIAVAPSGAGDKTGGEASPEKEKRAIPYTPRLVRHFTLRKTDIFRKAVLKTSIPYNDIRAFPLSHTVASDVFGRVVARHYLVVAVRLYNRTDLDRVVTVGMITARGRALVFPDDTVKAPVFTVPIAVSPARSSLVYTHIADERPNAPREFTFRILKFLGALLTATSVPFDFSEDLVSGISIFTGIAIPEGEKLVPDRIRGHLANVVTFGMPDVIKVPKGASAGGVLFFPKNKLHSLVMNAEYFQAVKNPPFVDDTIEQPHQYVAGLEVNSMDIVFENAMNPNEANAMKRAVEREERYQAKQANAPAPLVFLDPASNRPLQELHLKKQESMGKATYVGKYNVQLSRPVPDNRRAELVIAAWSSDVDLGPSVRIVDLDGKPLAPADGTAKRVQVTFSAKGDDKDRLHHVWSDPFVVEFAVADADGIRSSTFRMHHTLFSTVEGMDGVAALELRLPPETEPDKTSVAITPLKQDLNTDKLAFRGGGAIAVTPADPHFGGFSGMLVSADGKELTAVTDNGYYATATLDYTDGKLTGLLDFKLKEFKGGGDAESLAALANGTTVVSFEGKAKLLAYEKSDDPLAGNSKPIPAPSPAPVDANKGWEAMTALKDNRLFLLTEGLQGDKTQLAWIGKDDGSNWGTPIPYETEQGYLPSCAASVGDDVLVVERTQKSAVRILRVALGTVPKRITNDNAPELAAWKDLGNIEGIATRATKEGQTFVYLLSDNDFDKEKPTVLLMFELVK